MRTMTTSSLPQLARWLSWRRSPYACEGPVSSGPGVFLFRHLTASGASGCERWGARGKSRSSKRQKPVEGADALRADGNTRLARCAARCALRDRRPAPAGAEAAGSAAGDSAALAARARLGEHLDQHGAALARRRHLARKRDAHAVQPLTGADSQPEAQPIDSGHGRLIGGFAREMAGVSDERV